MKFAMTSWAEVFGPLTLTQNGYYSECAETCWDTVRQSTAEGIQWWLVLMVSDYAPEDRDFQEPDVSVDLWWVSPVGPHTKIGKTLKGPGKYGVFELTQASLAKAELEKALVNISEENRQMVLRKAQMTAEKQGE